MIWARFSQTYPELQHDVIVEGEEKASRLSFGSLPRDIPFIYSAFNQLYKVEPGIWDTWMEGGSSYFRALKI